MEKGYVAWASDISPDYTPFHAGLGGLVSRKKGDFIGREALEIAIACKHSAVLGNLPVRLPLADRSLFLDPSPYRMLGGDQTGNVQSSADAAGKENPPE